MISTTWSLSETKVEDDTTFHSIEVWKLCRLEEHSLLTTSWEVSLVENPVIKGLEGFSVEESWYTNKFWVSIHVGRERLVQRIIAHNIGVRGKPLCYHLPEGHKVALDALG